jgi:hypothetical protein
MEEGSFTVDKYAIHHEIKSPTTIIATATPRGIKWNDPFKLSNRGQSLLRAQISEQ